MTASKISAIYRDTGVAAYAGNPFIEALPPLQESFDSAAALRSSMRFQSDDLQKPELRAPTIFVGFPMSSFNHLADICC